MPPPATAYAVKDIQAGGSTVLSNWTSGVQLGEMPAGWWALVDTADGTKGRIFLDDGTTELAVDWSDFDNGAETGYIRFLIPSFSHITETVIRIYPPVAANSSVAVGATYGQYNAYNSDQKLSLPLNEAVNTISGGYGDRTLNGNDGTGVDMSLTAPAGQVGLAQDFDGSIDEIDINAVQTDIAGSSGLSVLIWIYLHSYGGAGEAFIAQILGDDVGGADGTFGIRIGADGTDSNKDKLYGQVHESGGNRDSISSTAVISLNGWHHVAFVWEQSGRKKLYLNGSEEADGAASSNAIQTGQTGTLFLGDDDARGRNWDGLQDEIQIYPVALSADRIREEFLQTDDPATYWGTWVLVGAEFESAMDVDFVVEVSMAAHLGAVASAVVDAIFPVAAVATADVPVAMAIDAIFPVTYATQVDAVAAILADAVLPVAIAGGVDFNASLAADFIVSSVLTASGADTPAERVIHVRQALREIAIPKEDRTHFVRNQSRSTKI